MIARRHQRAVWALFLVLSACLGGCGIHVVPVDYSFTAPLVSTPLGLAGPSDRRDAFAQVFCKALQQDPAHSRDDCTRYLELTNFVADGRQLPPLPDTYQVVVVAGIFSACLPRDQVSIFKQGLAQLRSEGLTHADEIVVSASGGTKEHAQTIGAYFRDHLDPKRPFIGIGYSQGAADLLQAYVDDPVVRDSLKALITVAGAVGGSRLPDGIPKSLDQLFNKLDITLPGCEIKTLQGLTALRRDVRYDFLVAHRDQLPRSYSIAAKSTRAKTSAILQPTWDQLTAYSIDEDSQVIRDDAVVPGGAYLGTALADHWAISLPFAEAHNPLFDRFIDQNPYPRTALLEALVRYVIADLATSP